jgi:hypothetical protein
MGRRETPKPKSNCSSAGGAGDVREENGDASVSNRRSAAWRSSNDELRRQLQCSRRLAILDWYGEILKAVATLSDREFEDFIDWDDNRSPGIPTSAWPGFVGRVAIRPGKTLQRDDGEKLQESTGVRPPGALPCSSLTDKHVAQAVSEAVKR